VSAALQSDTNAEVEVMLKEGVIQPSQSNWATPVLLVRKKDGRWRRFCIDYHPINKVMKKESFPMSDANEGLGGLGGSKFRSKFDTASGYWQLPMAPGGSLCDQAWTVQAGGNAPWTDKCASYVSTDDGGLHDFGHERQKGVGMH